MKSRRSSRRCPETIGRESPVARLRQHDLAIVRHAVCPVPGRSHIGLIPETPMPTDKKSPSTTKKLDELYALIDGIEIAMFTTRRPDGQLVSRPMATQERVTGTDLWFVTDISSSK